MGVRDRQAILERKRSEYRDMVPEYYESVARERSADEVGALRQVAVDVPRTAPGVPLFHMPQIQKSLERILYLWGIRYANTDIPAASSLFTVSAL